MVPLLNPPQTTQSAPSFPHAGSLLIHILRRYDVCPSETGQLVGLVLTLSPPGTADSPLNHPLKSNEPSSAEIFRQIAEDWAEKKWEKNKHRVCVGGTGTRRALSASSMSAAHPIVAHPPKTPVCLLLSSKKQTGLCAGNVPGETVKDEGKGAGARRESPQNTVQPDACEWR